MPGAAAQERDRRPRGGRVAARLAAEFAARITSTLDVRLPERESVAATGRDEIAAAIERWLDGLAGLEQR